MWPRFYQPAMQQGGSSLWIACALVLLLSACGDNGGTAAGGRVTYTVSGVISNLTADGLILELNQGNALTLGAATSAFEFPVGLSDGATYSVTIKQSPASETCVIQQGASGTISGSNIVGIAIICTAKEFTVGGTITNLLGTGLVIQDQTSGTSVDPKAGAGSYTLSSDYQTGQNYSIVVSQQPTNPTQTCSVNSASGQVSTSNVSNINVTCSTQSFAIGGAVSGLQGSGLTLTDTVSGQSYGVPASGLSSTAFAFAQPVPSGSQYQVQVTQQPTSLNQTCTVASGSGQVGNGPVTGVAVTCVTNRYGLSGTITGPAAADTTGLVLTETNTGVQAIISGTSFYFPFANNGIADGSSFNISIQEIESEYANANSHCLLDSTGADGTISGQAFTQVQVTCRYISTGLAAVGAGSSLGVLAGFVFDTVSGEVKYAQTAATSDANPVAVVGGPTLSQPGTGAETTLFVGNSGGTVSAVEFFYFPYTHEGITTDILSLTSAQADITAAGDVGSLFTDPSNAFLYTTTSSTAGGISTISISAAAAPLGTAVNSAAPGGAYTSLTFNQAGTYAALLASGNEEFYTMSQSATVFSRSPSTGALAQGIDVTTITGSGFGSPVEPAAAAFNGNNLYVLANSYQSSGPETYVPGGAPTVVGYSLSSNTAASLLPHSPYQSNIPTDFGVSLSFDPSNTYLFLTSQSVGISAFQVQSDGSLSLTAGSPFRADGAVGLSAPVIDPSGKFLYTLATSTNNIVAFRINLAPAAGATALSLIGVYPVSAATQLVMDSSGKFIYVLGNPPSATASVINGFFVDPNTGALTATPGNPYTAPGFFYHMSALTPPL